MNISSALEYVFTLFIYKIDKLAEEERRRKIEEERRMFREEEMREMASRLRKKKRERLEDGGDGDRAKTPESGEENGERKRSRRKERSRFVEKNGQVEVITNVPVRESSLLAVLGMQCA